MYPPVIFSARARYTPLFENARNRARFSKFKSILSGRSHRLIELEELIQGATIISQRSLGTQTVCIHRIQGTESRNADFDCDFNPLKNNNRDRWIDIASARLQDVGLPAIDLILVGDTYYVRDGRVVWCEMAASSHSRFKAGIKILRKVIQGNIATSRFRKQAILSLNIYSLIHLH